MDQTTPILLVPGLASSARIYAPVIPPLWRFGPVMVANHIRDDNMAAIARRVLSEAPPRFALAGHSMGGYIALEIMRQAGERVIKLALINTQARPDTPEATARRRGLMERARRGELRAIREESFPELVHPSRRDDAEILKLVHAQDEDVGVEGYLRQQAAIIARVDSRPTLSAISCPTLVLTGDTDNTIPNALSKEMAEGIAGARLVILERCGHLPQAEQPEATVRALTEWLGTEVV
ncbi:MULTISPECIES: alpha/beta fold hydrolase [Bradyrhizobium]|uniref:Alpha/beta hydrolase n=1 Tax=Bradyrhizobium nanningense TaxID=1325118 RepID=A0A4Q0RWM5_9BRAD|nr:MULTISPECIES: alpha/beta fold hydrolase [Bradyrhizobium]RXH23651.1 alpha/beta hydrolase [Bradyrhizobium nanningense]RXH31135.1 alpha/beta hydrolase [Bradyrhizobium nanningense]TQF33788.1 alpha/beta hydrolase [Bradyrhizobium sp. UNPA324]